MNIRGFRGLTKQKSLGRLFSNLSTNMIHIQETMCCYSQSLLPFSKLKPGWEFCAFDASGLSGGLLAGWNPLSVHCKAFTSLTGIILKATFKGLSETFTVINCYGPYTQRTVYWNNLVASGILRLPNLLLAGDLNFTISSSEVWGSKARIDPLAPFFSQLISCNNLVDLSMNLPGPTWRNGRSGEAGISKRLDGFLLSEYLLPILSFYRTWATPTDVSNHYPICLEWGLKLFS